ncbi:MAG: type II toxin-antitoxin system RelE/ParE family toxin [Steroidobacteraceae bacterium]
MRIEWSRRAHADLDWVEDYIAQDNPIAALEARETIERQVKLLKQQPRMGREGRVRGTRELVITALPYIVVYRVKAKAVQIARVLHGAQLWPQ